MALTNSGSMGAPGTSRVQAILQSTIMRFRLTADRAVHRPGSRRAPLPANAETMAKLLSEERDKAEEFWNDAIATNIEGEVFAQLADRIRPEKRAKLIAEPQGEWLQILRVIYVAVRFLQPTCAIETGVGPVGSTTSFILEAMRANGKGHLWSIDANRYWFVYGIRPGSGIPDRLLHRHTLVLGESRHELDKVLAAFPRIGLFVHDGDHTYVNVVRELQSVWQALDQKGIVFVDDARNNAVDDFARRARIEPQFIRYGPTPVGILIKNSREEITQSRMSFRND